MFFCLCFWGHFWKYSVQGKYLLLSKTVKIFCQWRSSLPVQLYNTQVYYWSTKTETEFSQNTVEVFSCFREGQRSTLVLVGESALSCCRQKKPVLWIREKAGAAAAQDAWAEGCWPQGSCVEPAQPLRGLCPWGHGGWAALAGLFVTEHGAAEQRPLWLLRLPWNPVHGGASE